MNSPNEKESTGKIVPSELAQILKVADENDSYKYDQMAMKIVSRKAIMAYILKSSLEEYADYEVKEIAEKFIEGEPELRKIALHQDHPDRKEKPGMMSGDDAIKGGPAVDKSQRERAVYYDIRFTALVPSDNERMEILINCEIQDYDKPGYPIPKRGIYYSARMISAQRGTVFMDQEYEKIKKVVSIWLCEDTANVRSDTINRYSLTEKCVRGDFHEKKMDYDLMTIVVLRLGSKGEESDDDAIRLMSRIFSADLSYEEKIDALESEFKISMTKEMRKEMRSMCNLSEGVYRKGYGSGITNGEMRKAKSMAYKLYDKGTSCEEIADMAEVELDTVKEWLAEREEALVK